MTPVNKERALTILSPLAALIIWQLASEAGLVNQRYVPSPLRIAEAGWDLTLSGQLCTTPARPCAGWWSDSSWAPPGVAIGMIMGLLGAPLSIRWWRPSIRSPRSPSCRSSCWCLAWRRLEGRRGGDGGAVPTIISTTAGVMRRANLFRRRAISARRGTSFYVILPGVLPRFLPACASAWASLWWS